MSRDDIICRNLGLVHTCAHRFTGRGIEYEDLFQAGCMGLIKAVDGFEEERGLRLSTYAVPLILGEMRRLFRDGGSVKIGRTLKELSLRAVREREAWVSRTGREPSITELAERLGVEREQAAEALNASLPPLSLTRFSGDDGEENDREIPIPSPDGPLTDRLALRQVLETLSPDDRALIEWRYFRRKTQAVTAAQLGMSQVQVSRRERAILQALRNQL